MRPYLPLLVTLVSLSCGGRESTTGKAPAQPRGARESRPGDRPAATPGVRVEIIQAGKGPRRALRYRLRPDQLGVMSTIFDTDVAYRSASGKMIHTPSPPMAMDLELTGMKIAGGVAQTGFRIARFDVASSPSDLTDEKTREAVRQRLQPMVGMTGSMEMDDHGRVHGLTWNVPDSLPPAFRSVLNSMSESGQEMVVPLPEEPVGIGAEWYAVKESPFMGMKLARTSRVALVGMRGDHITLRSSVDIAAGNQTFAFPGLPAGTTAELISCDGEGTAEMEIDLGWVAPARMIVQSRTDMTMELTTGGRKESAVVQARISMEIQRR